MNHDPLIQSGLLFWPLSLMAIALIWRLGGFKPDALPVAAKRKRVRLSLFDLAVGFGLILLGMVIFSILAAIGQGLEKSQGQPLLSESWKTALTTILSQLLTFFPAVLYFVVRCALQPGGWRRAGLEPDHLPLNVARGLVALLLVFPLVTGASLFCTWLGCRFGLPLPGSGHVLLKAMQHSDSRLATGWMIASAVIAAPLLEELFFRGLVQSSLGHRVELQDRPWRLVILSATLFSLIHASVVPWQGLAGLWVLGLALGWLYEKFGTLLPSILLHAGFNGLNILLAFLGSMDSVG